MGTATPAATGLGWAKALGNVNKPNSTAMSAAETTLFMMCSLPCSYRFILEAYFSLQKRLAGFHRCQLGTKKLSGQSKLMSEFCLSEDVEFGEKVLVLMTPYCLEYVAFDYLPR